MACGLVRIQGALLGAVVLQNFEWTSIDHDLFENFDAVDHLAGA